MWNRSGRGLESTRYPAPPTPLTLIDSKAYATVCVTACLGFMFGPAFPLAYIITLFALALVWWSWWYAILRFYIRPPAFSASMIPQVCM